MAYFLYCCQDIDDRERAARIRREHLHEHLAYVEQHLSRYAVAGPNRDPDGAYRASSFIVIADDLAEADSLMEGDPYVRGGLYRDVQGVEFIAVAGEWVGGAAWKK